MSEVVTTPLGIRIEFRQHDFTPGFAAYCADTGAFQGEAFCIIDVGNWLATVRAGDLTREEMVEEVAKSMMHECVHVIEHWAGAAFSEERVERLMATYDKWAIESGVAGDVKPHQCDFPEAIRLALEGVKVRRACWDPEEFVGIKDMGCGPQVAMWDGVRWFLWCPATDDMLAEDWEISYADDPARDQEGVKDAVCG